ncbi:MAG: outer membrane protein assembly factor BamE [Tagaea sp.]|nr:outer membrane protein assembly factor BamE [Tagaea sp.]
MRAFRSLMIAVCAASFVGGCGLARIDVRGYVPNDDELARLEPGRQTRDEVQQILGSPSSMGVFDAEQSWYYIYRKTSTTAFFEPDVLEQRVVVVHFDRQGTLRDVRRYALEDGLIVDPVTRTTPSPGREMSFLEQLLGNVGKFNRAPGAR